MGKKRARRESARSEATASEVKNAWHQYLARVSQSHEEIVITRYGKPIARLSPVHAPESAPGIFGWLRGTVTAHGDLIAPTGDEWEADA